MTKFYFKLKAACSNSKIILTPNLISIVSFNLILIILIIIIIIIIILLPYPK